MIGIFLDTETNGLNFRKHRILEIAFTLYDLKKNETITQFDQIIAQPDSVWESSDQESLRINGFKKEDLLKGISEKEAASQIKDLFITHSVSRGKAVFICQNPSFDRAFFGQLLPPEEQEALQLPYHWLDLASMFWATYYRKHQTFPIQVGLSKDKIASHFKLKPEQKPHKALNGVTHLIECYRAVIEQP